MENIKQAYETLGLPENASREEVEKRYYILIRRARSSRHREDTGEPDNSVESIDIDAVNKAYRLVIGAEEEQVQTEFNEKEYGKYRNMSGSAQKIDHFFSYYKFRVLGAIALAVLLLFGVRSYLGHKAEQERLAKLPPINLAISFFGDYKTGEGVNAELEPAEQKLLAQFPNWKRISAHLTYVPSEVKSDQNSAFVEKSILDLISIQSDLYILDKPNFIQLASQGALIKLDAATAPALQRFAASKGVKLASKEDTSQQIYGIDLSDSPLLKELNVNGKEYIAGIRANANHPAAAIEFISKYAESASSK